MVKKLFIVALCVLVLAMSCDLSSIEVGPVVESEKKDEVRYAEVCEGWQVDTSGDYGKIFWDAHFLINKEGTSVSYITIDGAKLTVVKDDISFCLHQDSPKAEFLEDKILFEFGSDVRYHIEFVRSK